MCQDSSIKTINLGNMFNNESLEFKARSAVETLIDREQNELLKFMFRIGDFDVRDYTVTAIDHRTSNIDGIYKIETEFKIEYTPSTEARKAAYKRLKDMYGNDFKRIAMFLHPGLFLMGDP